MYHPTIQKLDSVASDFHELGMMTEKNSALRLAGQMQQNLVARSPYPETRFLTAQWVWAVGHIGLLYQLIRWFKLREPDTKLVLIADGAASPHFLQAISPFLTIWRELPVEVAQQAMLGAVYFGCPDGLNTLVNFYKMIERDCKEINLLSLTEDQKKQAAEFAAQLGITGKYVALQARASAYDEKRNVSLQEVEHALTPYLDRGFQVISTGVEKHPINEKYRSVLELPDPKLASFLLSANCDQFVGSDSGAWTIPHAYQRPVELMNDYNRSAWIYP